MHKVDAAAYYEILPRSAHECGDIWVDLPSFGLLRSPTVTGILITPACDLSWGKSETANYLPVITIQSYFATDAALPLVVPRLSNLLVSLDESLDPSWDTSDFHAPPLEAVTDQIEILGFWEAGKRLGKREIGLLASARAGLTIMSAIVSRVPAEPTSASLSTFFGKEWARHKQNIVTNNFSPAVHFLPADLQPAGLSAVPRHSVVLFRYPLTVPLKILAMAQESTPVNWSDYVKTSSCSSMLQEMISQRYPVKMASLRSAFLSDLLTRYSALYNRVGSPDFTVMQVEQFCAEVGD